MRTINEITEEARDGARAESNHGDDLSLDGVMNAVGRLNGIDRTLVSIRTSDGDILVGADVASMSLRWISWMKS